MSDESSKIIVDDDWKAQVAAEKARAAALKSEKPTEPATAKASPILGLGGEPVTSPPVAAPSNDADEGPLPEASFESLLTMLFTQAFASLGQLPGPDGLGPDGQPAKVDKPMARHLIDTIEMLQTKTAGNLDDDEKQMIAGVLHTLRMAFVNTRG